MRQEGRGDNYGKIGKESPRQAIFRGPKATYSMRAEMDGDHQDHHFDRGMQKLMNKTTTRYPQIYNYADRPEIRLATIPVNQIDRSFDSKPRRTLFETIKNALGSKPRPRQSEIGDWHEFDTLVVVAQPIVRPNTAYDIRVAGICMSPDEFNTFKVLLKDPRDPQDGLEATKEMYRFITNTEPTATELFRITGIS